MREGVNPSQNLSPLLKQIEIKYSSQLRFLIPKEKEFI
jgi:hypothetical protein